MFLSPQRLLHLEDNTAFDSSIVQAFAEDSAFGLIEMAARHPSATLPSVTDDYWRNVAKQFLSRCLAENTLTPTHLENLNDWLNAAPITMRGVEYLDATVFADYWHRMSQHLLNRNIDLAEYLNERHSSWSMVGRVCLHLAENKNNPQHPFAFLATYTTHAGLRDKPRHQPLGQLLNDQHANRALVIAVLKPLQVAAEKNALLKELIDSKRIFSPQTFSIREAHSFLKNISEFEQMGLLVRIPNWWKQSRQPKVSVNIGGKSPSKIGLNGILEFDVQLSLGDEPLSAEELTLLLSAKEDLIQLRGQWVEANPDKLKQILQHWQDIKGNLKGGLSIAQSLRLLSGNEGLESDKALSAKQDHQWLEFRTGPWLAQTLKSLQSPDQFLDVRKVVHAHLRPYQETGLHWLWRLYQLRLGGILADDMGLGKTLQVLAFLRMLKNTSPEEQSLLIVPASLLENWRSEAEKFVPDLKMWIFHPSAKTTVDDYDVLVTSYGMIHRAPTLTDRKWHCVILDEAQNIKNAGSKQTKAVKSIASDYRLAITGTPIENRVQDLWSLFDFINPGLLGDAKTFADYTKKQAGASFSNLRKLVQPYILRRLKTDKTIIADLPDKTEMTVHCHLTPLQASAYSKTVDDLAKALKETPEGIKRRGLVLSTLMRLKQICNHPSQRTGDDQYDEKVSGKFQRLVQLAEEMASRQEKVLVFTQFRELCDVLHHLLAKVYARNGLVLHGSTPVKERQKLVKEFQGDGGPPFFILSLKAGGTGLNLTAASHVIHFDRWWNPAVENQATDRAFRIGQKRNVLVHKFLCVGTLEEKIDAMLQEKAGLARDVLGSGDEIKLTEMSNEEILQTLTLDADRALMN